MVPAGEMVAVVVAVAAGVEADRKHNDHKNFSVVGLMNSGEVSVQETI